MRHHGAAPVAVRGLLTALWIGLTTVVVCIGRPDRSLVEPDDPPAGSQTVLRQIYLEVLEMGRREDENFLMQEFHFDLDGREENKEEHILVMSHDFNGRREMILQITYFESIRPNSVVKYARDVKQIRCVILDKEIRILNNSYSEREARSLLPAVLEGIREEKKILKG